VFFRILIRTVSFLSVSVFSVASVVKTSAKIIAQKIVDCRDLAMLTHWWDRAWSVASVDEL
jgi:hypothetical protein